MDDDLECRICGKYCVSYPCGKCGYNGEEAEQPVERTRKKVSLEITLELNAVCPECDHYNDMRERDFECDYFWSSKATERLSGKNMEIKETHECYECGHVFEISDFEIQ